MKHLLKILFITLFIISCKNGGENSSEPSEAQDEIAYVSFGEKIQADQALAAKEMNEKFKDLTPGDSVQVKMTSKVNSVCQTKGCWMRLDLGNEEEVMVKFKDYGFFMPKNIAGQEVIIDGTAFVDEMTVEEQKHYAQDAGKSEEEIAAITEPKRTYTFVADGVLLKEE